MKFTVSLSTFQDLLQKTLPAIPPKSTLPVLEHLHFELESNTLKVIATDQDITIMSQIGVSGEIDGKILVPGRRLNEIIRALGNQGEVHFEANLENYEIKLKTQNGHYSMKGLNPNEYLEIPELFESHKPDLEDTDKDSQAFFTKDDINRLASKTVFAVSSDEFRPAMTGVLFQFRGDHVNAVSTDSYRLCRAIAQPEEGRQYPDELDIIIPSRSVELLRKPDDDVFMSVIENNGKITHCRFDIGDTIFITRIIDEKFPPYESVIPQDNDKFVTVERGELLSAIKRVAIFTSNISKQIKLILEENKIYLKGKDEEIGTDGDEYIPCEYTGSNMEIGFNYKYLEEALQNIDGKTEEDKIVMSFSEPTRPSLLKRSKDDENLLMLIMPVRIS